MRNDDKNGLNTPAEIHNRKDFFEKAAQLIEQSEPSKYTVSCINIDNFKAINAQYGAEVGDRVLIYVAECISKCMAEIGGIFGHIAGDDFAALFPTEYASSDLLAYSYDEASSPDCIYQNIRLRVGRFPADNISYSIDDMYDNAKLASNSIRENYETNIQYYRDDMRTELMKKQYIINEMHKALDCEEFEIWLQPQYNHATGAIIGAEVLIRWNKNGMNISPKDFIPIFERNGFIYEMDKYVWEKACILIRKWIDKGIEVLPLSINVSRRDLLHEDFIDCFTGIVKKYSVPAEMLRVEITESAFSESSANIISKVSKLMELGFLVEIDDFGSGYSSLNTLKDVPASILKLDMRFFESTENTQRAGNIIESVVRMAKWLGMAVIAEGVEKKELADYLKSIGCYYIQGFYYSKPIPISEYERLLERNKKEPELSRLKTIETLNNNEFWNPGSMDTLIFNSYVGGACIFEYYKGKTHILRLNDQYIQQFGGIIPPGIELHGAAVSKYMDDSGRKILFSTIEKAAATNEEASCEVKISNGKQTEYIRVAVRVIARTDDRILCYGGVVNMTE